MRPRVTNNVTNALIGIVRAKGVYPKRGGFKATKPMRNPPELLLSL